MWRLIQVYSYIGLVNQWKVLCFTVFGQKIREFTKITIFSKFFCDFTIFWKYLQKYLCFGKYLLKYGLQLDSTICNSVNWPRRGCNYGCIQYFCKYFQKFGIFAKYLEKKCSIFAKKKKIGLEYLWENSNIICFLLLWTSGIVLPLFI